jgi:hypothetical protein
MRDKPQTPMIRHKEGSRFGTFERKSVDQLLRTVPIGSRVAWTKLDSTGNENALLIGENKQGERLYAAQGYVHKIFTREQLENRIVRPTYDRRTIFVSEIETYKTP